MARYQAGLVLLQEMLGNGKDNVISLATIDLEANERGFPRPCVRDVDAYYEDETLYIITDARSNKIKQIEENPEVAISLHFEDFFSQGIAENRGWVMKPENSAIREKMRTIFKEWYEPTNDESDPNCCILSVKLTKGTLRLDHGREFYHFDFENKIAL